MYSITGNSFGLVTAVDVGVVEGVVLTLEVALEVTVETIVLLAVEVAVADCVVVPELVSVAVTVLVPEEVAVSEAVVVSVDTAEEEAVVVAVILRVVVGVLVTVLLAVVDTQVASKSTQHFPLTSSNVTSSIALSPIPLVHWPSHRQRPRTFPAKSTSVRNWPLPSISQKFSSPSLPAHVGRQPCPPGTKIVGAERGLHCGTLLVSSG